MLRPKKRRRNYTRLKILIAMIVAIVVIVFLLISNWTRIQLGMKGYGKEERTILLKLSDEEIDEYLSIDTIIDISKWNKTSNQKHFYDYELLKSRFKKQDEVITYVDSVYKQYDAFLSGNGYSRKNIRSLMKVFSLDDFAVLKEHKLTWKQIKPYLSVNGYVVEDIPEYLHTKLPPVKAIMQISYAAIDSSSQNTMTRMYSLDDPANITLLIKRGFYVPSDYVPKDLREVKIPNAPDNTNNKMRKEAASALERMSKDASKEGLVLALNSAYRSYEEQQAVYTEYFSIYDSVTAASLVAVPGCSEHQLGLSVDLTSQSVIDGKIGVFGNTAEYQWVMKHAHTYGFILRYPEDKTQITGTANEPWHFRYVGKELAEKLYKENLSLEEYTLQNGFNYPVSVKKEQ